MPHFIAAYPPAYGEGLSCVNFNKVDDESENPDSLSKTKTTSEQSSLHRLQTNFGNPARSLRLSPERCQKEIICRTMAARHNAWTTRPPSS